MDEHPDEMKSEYDFSHGERGKYANRFPPGSVTVLLDEDVAVVFHDSATVNDALRAVIAISKRLTLGSA